MPPPVPAIRTALAPPPHARPVITSQVDLALHALPVHTKRLQMHQHACYVLQAHTVTKQHEHQHARNVMQISIRQLEPAAVPRVQQVLILLRVLLHVKRVRKTPIVQTLREPQP